MHGKPGLVNNSISMHGFRSHWVFHNVVSTKQGRLAVLFFQAKLKKLIKINQTLKLPCQ
jgi:hypothetical protein